MRNRTGLGCGCLTLIGIVVLMTVLFMTVYKDSTQYGECVGLGQAKVDSLVYEPNIGNIILGIVGFETLIVPALITLTSLECPVGVK